MKLRTTVLDSRVCRKFEQKPIHDEDIAALLEAAAAVCTCAESENDLHLSVTQNGDVMNRIDHAVNLVFPEFAPSPTCQAPALFLLSVKDSGDALQTQMRCCDAGCVAERMISRAEERGLGTVPVRHIVTAVGSTGELRQLLRIPEHFIPVAAFVVGEPVEESEKLLMDTRMRMDCI